MAEDTEAEQDTEADADAEETKGGGMMKKIIFGVVGLALVAGGIFAGPVVMNKISGDPDAEATDESTVDKVTVDGPAIYNSLHPPLVINFKDAGGAAHFMQITMEVMARDQDVINAVREHTPVIRNSLILLYGNAEYEFVTTRPGKEKMLADGLAEIQTILTEQIGSPGIEAVYFTNLIIQ